jgi:hypothetical protein
VPGQTLKCCCWQQGFKDVLLLHSASFTSKAWSSFFPCYSPHMRHGLALTRTKSTEPFPAGGRYLVHLQLSIWKGIGADARLPLCCPTATPAVGARGCFCAACSVAASLEAQLAEAMHNLSCTQQELSKALSDYVSDDSPEC